MRKPILVVLVVLAVVACTPAAYRDVRPQSYKVGRITYKTHALWLDATTMRVRSHMDSMFPMTAIHDQYRQAIVAADQAAVDSGCESPERLDVTTYLDTHEVTYRCGQRTARPE